MTRAQLEHIIRAAAANANVRDIVVIGSQAILGPFPDAPASLTKSVEADVFPKDSPALSVLIDGAMGEMSLFHETFGYYAHGVDSTTAILPDGWEMRLVRVDSLGTTGSVGWCLEPHDLAVSKLSAGREKDYDFVNAMVRERLVQPSVVEQRLLMATKMSPQLREIASARLKKWREA